MNRKTKLLLSIKKEYIHVRHLNMIYDKSLPSIRPICKSLVDDGILVKISEDTYYPSEHVEFEELESAFNERFGSPRMNLKSELDRIGIKFNN